MSSAPYFVLVFLTHPFNGNCPIVSTRTHLVHKHQTATYRGGCHSKVSAQVQVGVHIIRGEIEYFVG